MAIKKGSRTKKVKKEEEEVVTSAPMAQVEEEVPQHAETSGDFIMMDNGDKIPKTFEGSEITSIGARKVAGETVFYNCTCENGSTYDVPTLN